MPALDREIDKRSPDSPSPPPWRFAAGIELTAAQSAQIGKRADDTLLLAPSTQRTPRGA